MKAASNESRFSAGAQTGVRHQGNGSGHRDLIERREERSETAFVTQNSPTATGDNPGLPCEWSSAAASGAAPLKHVAHHELQTIGIRAPGRRVGLSAIVDHLREVGPHRQMSPVAHAHADTDTVETHTPQFSRLG